MNHSRGKTIPGIFDGPVIPVTVKIGMPILLSSIVQFLYAMIDTWFIARLDPHSTALLSGTGLMFPIFFFFMALGGSLSTGVGALIGRVIGEGRREMGPAIMASGLTIGICFAIPVLVGGYAIGDRFVGILAGPELSQEARNYGLTFFHFLLPGLALMIAGQVLMGVLQGEGLTGTIAMASMVSTAVNAVLDPILIFGLHMGVAGAGLATTLSIALSVGIVTVQFRRGASMVPLSLNLARTKFVIVNELARIGFPQFLSMASLSISFMILNKVVSSIGQTAMNAWTLVGRMDQIVLMPSFAIAGATITIIAQNYGRRNLERIRVVYRRNVALGMAVVAAAALAYALGAPFFFRAFTEVREVIDLASMQVRILAVTFVCISASIISASMFQATGKPVMALVVTLIRMGLVSIPAALICAFTLGMGYMGVVLGLAIGNVVVLPVALYWGFRHLRGLTFRTVAEAGQPQAEMAPVVPPS